jgi:3-oxoacyl-[acyl-carrier protein] reductase
VVVNYNASGPEAKAVVAGPHGVTVNAIAPGGIDTAESRGDDSRVPGAAGRRAPVRHLGQVEDVAYCAVFLAAQDAHDLTGQVLQPNGGWAMA